MSANMPHPTDSVILSGRAPVDDDEEGAFAPWGSPDRVRIFAPEVGCTVETLGTLEVLLFEGLRVVLCPAINECGSGVAEDELCASKVLENVEECVEKYVEDEGAEVEGGRGRRVTRSLVPESSNESGSSEFSSWW